MSSKRSVLKKMRAGLVGVPDGWEALVEATQPAPGAETISAPETTATTTISPPVTTTATEDFRSSFPRTTKADTTITASKKRTGKTPTARKTKKPQKRN